MSTYGYSEDENQPDEQEMEPEEADFLMDRAKNTLPLIGNFFELDVITTADLEACAKEFIVKRFPAWHQNALPYLSDHDAINPLHRPHECDSRCVECYPISHFEHWKEEKNLPKATEKDFGVTKPTKPHFQKKRFRKQNKKQTSWR